jgi:hypothetical protein
MITPRFLMGRALLPPRKANHGFDSCSSESFKWQAVKYKAVAVVRLGNLQPGILPRKKYLNPQLIEFAEMIGKRLEGVNPYS